MTTASEKLQAPTGTRWRYLPRLIRLLFAFDRKNAAMLVFWQVASGAFVTLGVYLLYRLIEVAHDVVRGDAPFAEGMLWAGSLVGFQIMRTGFGTISRVTADRFQEALRGHIEETCYAKAQSLPLAQLETPEYHDQLQRVRRGMDRRLFSTMSFLWRCVGDIVALVSLLLYLGSFHWGLPLLLIVGTTPGVLIRERVHRQRYLVQRQQTTRERRFSAYTQLFTGRHAAAEIRMFGFGNWLIKQADALWQGLARERIAQSGKEARATLISDGLNAVVYVVAITFSLGLLLAGRAAIGAYAAFFYAIENFQNHYWGLAWNISIIYSDLRYVQDFFDFLDHPSIDYGVGQGLDSPIQQGIVFEDVSFTYPGSERPALSGINLTIRPGERIALVGENGAGKSTLVKLLMGLYTPSSGKIRVDGVDLQSIAPAEWYQRLGAVFQDYNRYEATAGENIAFGWIEQAHRADLIADAAARSGASEVAAGLPEGLNTPLGKTYREGTELSVGQWQKLAIARAYMRPAEVLVLDEPASALDARAEADVYDHFARMSEGRTVILISHRLGSCRMADRIIVLNDGKLVEEGSHQALLAQAGEYALMYQSQAEWYR